MTIEIVEYKTLQINILKNFGNEFQEFLVMAPNCPSYTIFPLKNSSKFSQYYLLIKTETKKADDFEL